MPNSFDELAEMAGRQGVIVRRFCSFCPNEKTGTITTFDTKDQQVTLDVCLTCAKRLAKMYNVSDASGEVNT